MPKLKAASPKIRDNPSNTHNSVTVQAEPIVSTANIDSIPEYSDLSTVIYVWGDNPGDLTRRSEYWNPAVYRSLAGVRIVELSCSESHILLLSDTGLLYSMGHGEYGQLGLSQGIVHVSEPTLVPRISNVKEVRCGRYHSVALVDQGRLYSWGRNDFSGHPDGFATYVPREILTNQENSPGVGIKCNTIGSSDLATIAVCDEGRCLYFWGIAFNGERIPTPKVLFSFSRERIKCVGVGAHFAVALSECGSLFHYGDGTYGEIYSKSTITSFTPIFTPIKHTLLGRAVSISVSNRHVLVLDERGGVIAFGGNNYGQCGVPQAHHVGPVSVEFAEGSFLPSSLHTGHRTSACINSGNQLYVWGHSSNHKLIFTSSVDILIQQQKQPGVSIVSGYKNCITQPRLIYSLLQEKITCVGLGPNYTVVVSGEGVPN